MTESFDGESTLVLIQSQDLLLSGVSPVDSMDPIVSQLASLFRWIGWTSTGVHVLVRVGFRRLYSSGLVVYLGTDLTVGCFII